MGFDISLSPSKIGVLKDCAGCFYDENVLKIPRPRGIFPSLPGGVDRVMKDCLDAYRGSMMPSLKDKLPGKLWGTKQQIDKLRNWRSGLKVTLTVQNKTVSLIGALDDLILEPNDSYSPFDTKTKGKEPESDGSEYYLHQLDLYALMLRENGMPPSGKGYLDYWFPIQFGGELMKWGSKLFTLSLDPQRGVEWIEKAVTVMVGTRPSSSPNCEYCKFGMAHIGMAASEARKNAAMAGKDTVTYGK